MPSITDFEEFNEQLLHKCDQDLKREHYKHGKTLMELWLEEKPYLLNLPEHEYDVFSYENLTVKKDGFILIDKVRYGLNPQMSNM